MFTLDDLCQRLNAKNGIRSELFSRTGKIISLSADETLKLFPVLREASNQNVVYAAVAMAHALPSVNQKGRAFTLKTLINSSRSVPDNLVNVEHQLIDNGKDRDSICGHIKAVAIPGHSIAGISEDPDAPQALVALTAIYGRHKDAAKIINEHTSGIPWFVSMECAYDIASSAILYDGQFIPIRGADSDMLECIQLDSVRQYKGKPMAFVLGGESGEVSFNGLALTRQPADTDSNILSMVAVNRAARSQKSAASLFCPVAMSQSVASTDIRDNLQIANDNLLQELSRIEPIGYTDPAPDGHVHEVMSDGTILPALNHTHYMRNFAIEAGSNPTFSATLETFDVWDRSEYSETRRSHTHKLLIQLRPKKQAGSASQFTELSGEDDMPKILESLQEALQSVKNAQQELSAKSQGKAPEDNPALATALNALSAIEKLNLPSAVETATKEKIDEQIASGDLIPKDKVEEAIAAATQAVKDEYAAKAKAEAMVSSRLDAVKAIKIDPNAVISGEGDSAVTVESFVKSFALDDAGEKQFQTNLAVWSKLAAKATASSEPAKPKSQETASTAKAESLLIVGAGSTVTPESQQQNADQPKFGRHAITSL